MNEKVLLSIIIPSFQQAEELAGALGSISKQDFKNFEIIIVDGGSDVSVKNTVSLFIDLPIVFVSEPDKGVYDAMNKGIKLASGEWLYFLGSDDILCDGVLTRIEPEIYNNNKDIIYGDVILTSDSSRYSGSFDLHRLLFERNICHQAIFYKKSVFERLGFYNLKYKIWADWEFNIRCFRHTELTIQYIDVIIALYNDQSGISRVHDDVLCEELPWVHIDRINNLKAEKQAVLMSKSFLIGNKLINIFNKIFKH